jgi:DNA-3-methyladenine glycosylase I
MDSAPSQKRPVPDYEAIFKKVESTLLRQGSREQVVASLEPSKHLEGKCFTDNECYRMLVHIAFFAGFKANIVAQRLPAIDEAFPNYKTVAKFDERDFDRLRNDDRIIRHPGKIKASINNARAVEAIVASYGSFQGWLNSLPYPESDQQIIAVRDEFRRRFGFLGKRVAFHLMTDLGLPVLKPDRVIERIFKRLGLVPTSLQDDKLFLALIQEGRKLATAAGFPIRYIDRVFVAYGQVQTTDMGLSRGICLKRNPGCSICEAKTHCQYYRAGHAHA